MSGYPSTLCRPAVDLLAIQRCKFKKSFEASDINKHWYMYLKNNKKMQRLRDIQILKHLDAIMSRCQNILAPKRHGAEASRWQDFNAKMSARKYHRPHTQIYTQDRTRNYKQTQTATSDPHLEPHPNPHADSHSNPRLHFRRSLH